LTSPRNTIGKALPLILILAIAASAIPTALPTHASAQASGSLVLRGATPVPEGDATNPDDLTLINEYLAVTIAVGSTPPWGVTKGNIMDGAPIKDGKILQDVLAQFSFLVNGWGNWATPESIEVLQNGSGAAVVRVTGYWNDVKVVTTYRLEDGKNYLEIETTITNEGGSTYDLTTGYAMSLRRGWTFTPGFGTGTHYSPTPKEELGVLDDWTSGYHEDFAVGLWAPYYTHLSTSTSWVDPLTKIRLGPGESKTFTAYLIFVPEGSTNAILQTIAQIKGEALGTVTGSVKTTDGTAVEDPIAVVLKDGKPYCWGIGSGGTYSLYLPPGDYSIHIEAKGYGPSGDHAVTVTAGSTTTLDIRDVQIPGKVSITAYDASTNKPLDAKILISGGPETIIQYLKTDVVYTDPDNIGHVTIELAPGTYDIRVEHGAGFISKPVEFQGVNVTSKADISLEAGINIEIDPNTYGYYSADLHHHSNILDGRTPPEYLVVAQAAAGLDFAFVSDHDSVANWGIIQQYASARGMPFIPSVEISPAWAHFNPYPITNPGALIYRGTAKEILEAARAAGAIVIRMNHPYTGSGYLHAIENNIVPGGYWPDWDVAEINGRFGRDDNATLKYMMMLWDLGIMRYITAGSDTHDIWASPYTGSPRVYAYIEGEPTPEAFAIAEKNGHTFITYGPLIFLHPVPGTIIPAGNGNITVTADIHAVDGISRVMVIGTGGQRLLDKAFDNAPNKATLDISISPDTLLTKGKQTGWVIVMVWDSDGDLAITNPVWVTKAASISERTTTQTVTATTTETVTQTTTETVTEYSTTTETTTVTAEQPVGYPATTVAAVAVILLIAGLAIGFAVGRRR